MPEQEPVLFVDDEPAVLRSLQRGLEARIAAGHEGPRFQFLEATNAKEAIEIAKKKKPLVCVLDLSLDETVGPQSGLDLLRELLTLDSTTKALVLTGHNTDEFGLRALQAGASSFLSKPAKAEHLLPLISDAISHCKLKRLYSASILRSSVESFDSLSPSMKDVISEINFAASTKQPLMILGQTGCGKGVLARAIHKAGSKGLFVRFQPSFGSQDLISSELFGHVKGAFTGATTDREGLIAQAKGGTLFVDEVDALPIETQVMLLEVLQEKVFRRVGSSKEEHSDFRLITATNADIPKAIADKKLRQDFFHRISHLKVTLPPLRERKEDLPVLSKSFIESIANTEKLLVHSLSESAQAKLQSHTWPGNIRELKAVIEGACFRADFEKRSVLEADDIALELPAATSEHDSGSETFRGRVHKFEAQLVDEALKAASGNQSKAAKSLGLDRSSLRRILER